MMLRVLILFLIAGSIVARASEKIDAPADGASTLVTQPHVTAELIPESTSVQAGKPFDIALHLHTDPDWHTYWINPGDAGLATMIKWTLPPKASPQAQSSGRRRRITAWGRWSPSATAAMSIC